MKPGWPQTLCFAKASEGGPAGFCSASLVRRDAKSRLLIPIIVWRWYP